MNPDVQLERIDAVIADIEAVSDEREAVMGTALSVATVLRMARDGITRLDDLLNDR